MTQTDWLLIGVAVVLAVVAFILAAAETALQAVSAARAEELVEEETRGAKKLLTIVQDPAPFVNTVMLVRITTEILVTVLVAHVVFDLFERLWQDLLVTTLIMVIVAFIAWGVAPRTLGRQKAVGVALRAAGVVRLLTAIFGWLVNLLILLGNALTPGRGYVDGPFTTEAELRELVDMAEASDVIESDEREMIHSVFELGDTLAREVMVPRTDIVFIERYKSLRQAISLSLRSGFSRIPVIGDDLDDLLGVVYVKDLLRRIYDLPTAEKSETVESLMRSAVFCPDSKPLDDLLREMQQDRSHIVIVVDEFGGTAGLATIEDIVEEIVGEITDEYDAEPTLVQEREDGAYLVSARMPLDDVGDLFGLELDDEDVDTVGGLMAKQLRMVPIPGAAIEWEGLRITAERATGRRNLIDTVLVERLERADRDDSEDNDDDD